jgi:hypothetical protein
VWEEYEEAEKFFKKIRNLRDESVDKSILSDKLRDAVADNPDAFVNLMDEMLDVLKTTKKSGSHGEARREPKDLLVFPAPYGSSRDENAEKHRHTMDTDEASVCASVCKSVITFSGSMEEVEVRHIDDDESQASVMSYASYAMDTLRNLRKHLNKNTELASSLAREVEQITLTGATVRRPDGATEARDDTVEHSTSPKRPSQSDSLVRELNLPPSNHRDDVSLLSEMDYVDNIAIRDPSGKKSRKGMLGWIFKPKKLRMRGATREKKRSTSSQVHKPQDAESLSTVSQPLVVQVAQYSCSKSPAQVTNVKKTKGGGGAFVPIGLDPTRKSRLVLSTLQHKVSKVAQKTIVLDYNQEVSRPGENDRGHFVAQDPSDQKRNYQSPGNPTGEGIDHVLRILSVPKTAVDGKDMVETRKSELETSSSPSNETQNSASSSLLERRRVLESELVTGADPESQALAAKELRCLRKQIQALTRELSDVPDVANTNQKTAGTQQWNGSDVVSGLPVYRHVGTIAFSDLFPNSTDVANNASSKIEEMAKMEEPPNDINETFSGDSSLEQESLYSAESEDELLLHPDNLAASFMYAMGTMLVNQMADKGV